MKRTGRIVAILLLVCMVGTLFAACSSNPFVGKWNAYKISKGDEELYYADFESFHKMELTAEFTSDNTYVFHYYVNGEEHSDYPQSGTYVLEDGKLLLDNGSTVVIEGDELIVTLANGLNKQFFKAA